MKKVIVTVVSLFVLTGISAPAQASQGVAKKYSSCADLLVKYPNGVAKSKKARTQAVKDGFAKPKVSKSLYKENGARLDRDRDGVMCEQEGQTQDVRWPSSNGDLLNVIIGAVFNDSVSPQIGSAPPGIASLPGSVRSKLVIQNRFEANGLTLWQFSMGPITADQVDAICDAMDAARVLEQRRLCDVVGEVSVG